MPDMVRPQPSPLYRWSVLAFISVAQGGNYYIYDSINPLERIFIDKLRTSTPPSSGVVELELQRGWR